MRTCTCAACAKVGMDWSSRRRAGPAPPRARIPIAAAQWSGCNRMDLAACAKALDALERAHAAPDLEAALQSLAQNLAAGGEPDAKKARRAGSTSARRSRRPQSISEGLPKLLQGYSYTPKPD